VDRGTGTHIPEAAGRNRVRRPPHFGAERGPNEQSKMLAGSSAKARCRTWDHERRMP